MDFLVATHVLLKPVRGSRGSLVGYSAAGPPLYNFAGEALQRTSQSLLVIAKNGLRQILEESDSRRIFFFLCINLVSFCKMNELQMGSLAWMSYHFRV